MLRYLPRFAACFHQTYAWMSDRWRRCALPAGTWLPLILAMILVLFTNDPPWPASFLHLSYVGPMV